MRSNADAIACWNAQAGDAWVRVQDAMDRAFEPFGAAAEAALELRGGERVLDVGCGCGSTTLALARAVGERGSVTGVDVSGPMLERAAERAERAGFAGRIHWLRQDAQTADLGERAYDAVYSRFGVMFFADPRAAFANFARATRETGRLAFVCWQSRAANVWFDAPARAAAAYVEMVAPARDDRPGPFGLASAERMRAILVGAGWRDVELVSSQAPVLVGANIEEAIGLLTMIGPVGAALRQAGVSDARRARVLAAMRGALSQFATGDGVRVPAAGWLFRARRSPPPRLQASRVAARHRASHRRYAPVKNRRYAPIRTAPAQRGTRRVARQPAAKVTVRRQSGR
jgi:SAM-dependent methyltransferase